MLDFPTWQRRPVALILTFVVSWFAVDGLALAPAFGHTDVYYFKDAALNFAEGLGLKTRFCYGNPSFAYRDYATYPPFYPIVFGLYARAAGISTTANQAFNSAVAILVGLAGCVALWPTLTRIGSGARRSVLVTFIGFAAVAFGFFAPANDRPDGLAAALGITAILMALRGTSSLSMAAAGSICAVTLFTSPFAGIWTGVLLLLGLWAKRHTPSLRLALPDVAWLCVGGGATATLSLALILWQLPGWFGGFFGVATGSNTHNETGGGYFLALMRGDFHTWSQGFPYSMHGPLTPLLQLCAVSTVLAASIAADRWKHGNTGWAWRLVPLLVVSPLCLVTSPYQTHYPPMAAALLVTAWAAVVATRVGGPSRADSIAIVIAFSLVVVLAIPGRAGYLLQRTGTRASLERSVAFLARHRASMEATGGFIAVSPSNYMAWREAGLHPLITVYPGLAEPANRISIHFVALAYPGSGNLMTPQGLELVPQGEYRRVFEPDLPQPTVVFGRRFSNSSQTWESEIFARRTCMDCPMQLAVPEPSASP
jgi:hypothetical protein